MEAPNDGLGRENERWRLMCEDQRSQLQSLRRELEAEQEARRAAEQEEVDAKALMEEALDRTDEAEARLEELALLLRKAWEFPDQPGPADGEMADEEVWAEQQRWQKAWEDLDGRIRAALTPKDTEEDP